MKLDSSAEYDGRLKAAGEQGWEAYAVLGIHKFGHMILLKRPGNFIDPSCAEIV